MISKLTRGFLDGSLSTLGVVIGASAGSPSLIVAAGLGGALANAASNVLSAFTADSMESYAELREVERAMVVTRLAGTGADVTAGGRPVRAGLQDGAATLVGGAIPVVPYFFLDSLPAMLTAVGLVAASTFVVGLYLGILSRRNMLAMALKTTTLAVLVAIVVYLVQALIAPDAA